MEGRCPICDVDGSYILTRSRKRLALYSSTGWHIGVFVKSCFDDPKAQKFERALPRLHYEHGLQQGPPSPAGQSGFDP